MFPSLYRGHCPVLFFFFHPDAAAAASPCLHFWFVVGLGGGGVVGVHLEPRLVILYWNKV